MDRSKIELKGVKTHIFSPKTHIEEIDYDRALLLLDERSLGNRETRNLNFALTFLYHGSRLFNGNQPKKMVGNFFY